MYFGVKESKISLKFRRLKAILKMVRNDFSNYFFLGMADLKQGFQNCKGMSYVVFFNRRTSIIIIFNLSPF